MLTSLRLAAPLFATLVLSTGCGSLAQQADAPATQDAGVLGLDAAPAPTAEAGSVATGDLGPGSPTAPGATASAGSTGGGTPQRSIPRTGGTTLVRPGTSVPAVTNNPGPKVAPSAPIRLGIIGVDTSAIAGQFGQKSTIDTFDRIKTMISYLNANGGVAGHQIKPVFVRVDSAAEFEQAGQVACTSLTQDNTVDMALSLGFPSQSLNTCLLQKGISLFSNMNWASDAQWMAQYPNLFLPVAMRADRYSAAAITSAIQQGTLKSGDKLGVLVEDCAWGNRIYDNVIVPLANKHGVTTEKGTVTCITNLVKDLGPVTQDLMRNALLMATKGATHVFSLSMAEGYFSTTFSRVASTQQYFPKYLVTSVGNPIVAMDQKAIVHFAPDAVKNVIGVGFRPALDVGPKAQPTTQQAAQQNLCKKMDPTWGGARIDGGGIDYFTLDGFYGVCDTLNAIKTVLTSNGNKFGLADMAAGYQSVLVNGVSATAVGGRYGGGVFRHDGLGLASPMAYSATTGRLSYTGTAFAVG
jgi:hypothetical protein